MNTRKCKNRKMCCCLSGLWRIAVVVLLLLQTKVLEAQVGGSTSLGRDFYVVWGSNNRESVFTPNTPIRLEVRLVGGSQETKVNLYSRSGYDKEYVLQPNETKVVVLDERVYIRNYIGMPSEINTVTDKGLRITSDHDIAVYALNYRHASVDATLVWPVSVLGTEYELILFTGYTIYDGGAMVIATEDNTSVTFVLGDSISSTTLDKGQAYYYGKAGDPTGLHIVADRVVSVFATSEAVYVPAPYRTTDNLYEHLPPITFFGKNYFLPSTNRQRDYLRMMSLNEGITRSIVTEQDGTKNSFTFSEKGQVYSFDLEGTDITHLLSDKRIAVAFFMVGDSYTSDVDGDGDPALAFVAPEDQGANYAVVAPFFPTVTNNLKINRMVMITKSTNKSNVLVNGVAPSGGVWRDHPDGHSSYDFELGDQTYVITSSRAEGVISYVYGYGNDESYMYLASSGARDLTALVRVNGYAEGQGASFYCGDTLRMEGIAMGDGITSIKWYIDGVYQAQLDGQVNWDLEPAEQGSYSIEMVVTDALGSDTARAYVPRLSRVVDDYATAVQDWQQTIKVLANDVLSDTKFSELIYTGSGTVLANADSSAVLYKRSVVGPDSFQYVIGSGNCRDTAWVRITVTQVPDWVSLASDCNGPASATVWGVELVDSSVVEVSSYVSPLVADIDGDGESEVVTLNCLETNGDYNPRISTELLVFNSDLTLRRTITIPTVGWADFTPFAIGKVKHGGVDKVIAFLISSPGIYANKDGTTINAPDTAKVFAYDLNTGAQLWRSNATYLHPDAYNLSGERIDVGHDAIGLADFDADGLVEVYVNAAVFDAHTGVRLLPPTAAGAEWGSSSFAADFVKDGAPELAHGSILYEIDITSRTDETLNTRRSVSSLTDPMYGMGRTAVADVDKDGDLDIVVAHGFTPYPYAGIGVYAWDGQTNEVLFSFTPENHTTTSFYALPMIGDLDNDKQEDITFISRVAIPSSSPQLYKMYSIKYDETATDGYVVNWELDHDDPSGMTGMSLFDFNSDGQMEIVYRDEACLRIINGSGKSHITSNDTLNVDGEPLVYDLVSFNMGENGTGWEYPVIADINGDGSADIITTGRGSSIQTGYLCLFQSPDPSDWASARSVWNQHMYNGFNVNDDLSIPRYPSSPAFVSGDVNGEVFQPFNSFFRQYSWEDVEGNYVTPQADLSLVPGTYSCVPNGTHDTLLIRFDYTNLGDRPFYGVEDSIVSFYSGSAMNGSDFLWKDTLFTTEYLEVGELRHALLRRAISDFESGLPDVVFVRLNDEAVAFPDNALQLECNYENNRDSFCLLDARDDRYLVSASRSDRTFQTSFYVFENDFFGGNVAGRILSFPEGRLEGYDENYSFSDTLRYFAPLSVGEDRFTYELVNGEQCSDTAVVHIAVSSYCPEYLLPPGDSVPAAYFDFYYAFELGNEVLPDSTLVVFNDVDTLDFDYDTVRSIAGRSVYLNGGGGFSSNNPAYLTSPITDMSLSLWIKAADPAEAKRQVIFEEGDSTAGWSISLQAEKLQLRVVSDSTNAIEVDSIDVPGAISDTLWHHLFVWKKGTELHLFVDASAVGAMRTVETIPSHKSEAAFATYKGSYPEAGARPGDLIPFKGHIDDLGYVYKAIPLGGLLTYWDCAKPPIQVFDNVSECEFEALRVSTLYKNDDPADSIVGISWSFVNLFTGENSVHNTEDAFKVGLQGVNAIGKMHGGLQYILGVSERPDENGFHYFTVTGLDREGRFETKFIAPAPVSSKAGATVGDIYYYYDSAAGMIRSVNLNPLENNYLEVYADSVLLPAGVKVSDFLISPLDSNLYIVGDKEAGLSHHLYAYAYDSSDGLRNLVRSRAVTYPLGGQLSGDMHYKSVFVSSSGYLYAYRAEDGQIFRTLTTDVANFGVFEFVVQSEVYLEGDGASCEIALLHIDFGDAPDRQHSVTGGDYHADLLHDGPRHYLEDYDDISHQSSLMLGEFVDIETNGPDNSRFAVGDDTTGIQKNEAGTVILYDGDDEDGILGAVPTYSIIDTAYRLSLRVRNALSEPATLLGWLDMDGDGFTGGDSVEFTSLVIAPVTMDAAGDTTLTLEWKNKGKALPFKRLMDTTYLRLRLTTDTGVINNRRFGGMAKDGEVEDYMLVSLDEFDYGDAPAKYRTLEANNGAVHLLSPDLVKNMDGNPGADGKPDLLLGAIIDAESDGRPVAFWKDNTGTKGDGLDEDGISNLPVASKYSSSYQCDVKGVNHTADTAYLSAWLDWNRDAVFSENERVDYVIPPGGGFNKTLLWNAINFKINGIDSSGFAYMRVRLSSAPVDNAWGMAAGGEVEDYRIEIMSYDPWVAECGGRFFIETFGDVSDGLGNHIPLQAPARTTYAFANLSTTYPLGPENVYAVTNNPEALHPHFGGADHTTGVVGRGRQLAVNAAASRGIFYTVDRIQVSPYTSYQLKFYVKNLLRPDNYWDYYLPDVTAQVLNAAGAVVASVSTGDVAYGRVWYEYTMTFNTETMREVQLRFVNNTPQGRGNDLAIDDITLIAYCDAGDLPDASTDLVAHVPPTRRGQYRTKFSNNGPAHYTPKPSENIYIGTPPDRESNGLPTVDARGDDLSGVDDEDLLVTGETLLTVRKPEGHFFELTVPVTNNTGSKGYVYGFLDIDNDGTFDSPGEITYDSIAGTMTKKDCKLSFKLPFSLASGKYYLRLRVGTNEASVSEIMTFSSDGEVEDYQFYMDVVSFDYGDAPSSYDTVSHIVLPEASNVYLGYVSPDLDPVVNPTATAEGDDVTNVDDEDGLDFSHATTDGYGILIDSVLVINHTGKDAYLYAWVDYNADGSFDAAERALVNIPGNSDTLWVQLSINSLGPSDIVIPGNYFARLRVSTDVLAGNNSSMAKDGEVEDHLICISPSEMRVSGNSVWACIGDTLNLNDLLPAGDITSTGAYETFVSDSIISWTIAHRNVDVTADSASFVLANHTEVDNTLRVNFRIQEVHCGEDTLVGDGAVYIRPILNKALDSASLRVCFDDAGRIDLNDVLGFEGEGSWSVVSKPTSVTVSESDWLEGNLFLGHIALGSPNDPGQDMVFTFQYTPAPGECVINRPKVTVIITDSNF